MIYIIVYYIGYKYTVIIIMDSVDCTAAAATTEVPLMLNGNSIRELIFVTYCVLLICLLIAILLQLLHIGKLIVRKGMVPIPPPFMQQRCTCCDITPDEINRQHRFRELIMNRDRTAANQYETLPPPPMTTFGLVNEY